MTTAAPASVIPCITAREGEEPDYTANLGVLPGGRRSAFHAPDQLRIWTSTLFTQPSSGVSA